MKIQKLCGCCGKVHNEVPNDARVWNDRIFQGWVWECDCKSSLQYPTEEFSKILQAKRAARAALQAQK